MKIGEEHQKARNALVRYGLLLNAILYSGALKLALMKDAELIGSNGKGAVVQITGETLKLSWFALIWMTYLFVRWMFCFVEDQILAETEDADTRLRDYFVLAAARKRANVFNAIFLAFEIAVPAALYIAFVGRKFNWW
jgi:hypothetical protein